jgi:hypothetical protein
MQAHLEIKRFVQETLGCSCPDEVFAKIHYRKGSGSLSRRKITVGDRLLIYIINIDTKSSTREVIKTALEQGIAERDGKGLNRFRLVLVASHPDDLRKPAELAFESSGYSDEKSHLHLVSESDVEGF